MTPDQMVTVVVEKINTRASDLMQYDSIQLRGALITAINKMDATELNTQGTSQIIDYGILIAAIGTSIAVQASMIENNQYKKGKT